MDDLWKTAYNSSFIQTQIKRKEIKSYTQLQNINIATYLHSAQNILINFLQISLLRLEKRKRNEDKQNIEQNQINNATILHSAKNKDYLPRIPLKDRVGKEDR